MFTGPVFLPATKKITYAIVGVTGSGSLTVVVRYTPLAVGATLA